MADSQASAKRKLGEVLHTLEKAYGKVCVLADEPPLDHAVYLLLRENWDYRKAARALRALQREYVDWNEIRVTTAGELKSFLAPMGDRELDVKIEKIRTLLDNVYRDQNSVDLSFLLEMDEERQRSFLNSMGVFSAAQVQILICAMAGPERWQVPAGAIRVLTRVGILPRVYSPASARNHALKILDPADLFAFHAHLVQHGEDVCLLKSPRCRECVIVEPCGFKRKVGVAGGR